MGEDIGCDEDPRLRRSSYAAGQGTVGREFEMQAPDLTTVLVAVGGGGLIGGIAAWYRGKTRALRSNRKERQRCTKRSKPADRSMLPPAALRRIRWRLARSDS